jgi:hypothetical protein
MRVVEVPIEPARNADALVGYARAVNLVKLFEVDFRSGHTQVLAERCLDSGGKAHDPIVALPSPLRTKRAA